MRNISQKILLVPQITAMDLNNAMMGWASWTFKNCGLTLVEASLLSNPGEGNICNNLYKGNIHK